jgi:uncharacterized low-complexity protein
MSPISASRPSLNEGGQVARQPSSAGLKLTEILFMSTLVSRSAASLTNLNTTPRTGAPGSAFLAATALALSLPLAAQAAATPHSALHSQALSQGYQSVQVAAADMPTEAMPAARKASDGKCGEGKCGANKRKKKAEAKPAKHADGSCGADKGAAMGTAMGEKMGEHMDKHGDGSCGASRPATGGAK